MLRGIDKVMLGLLLQDGFLQCLKPSVRSASTQSYWMNVLGRKITGNKCVLGLGVNRGSGRRQRERETEEMQSPERLEELLELAWELARILTFPQNLS